MRVQTISLAILTAVVVAGCASDRPVAPRSGPSFSVTGGGAKTYVLLGAGNVLPPGLAATVQAAGGSLTASLNGIGVAVATSSNPSFMARVSRVKGVQAVAEDVVIDFGQPRVEGMIEADGPAGPILGEAGVGAGEAFRAVQWAPDAVHAPEAWDAGFQGQGARVAILDGGIHSTHIDIAPNLDVAHSTSFVPGKPYNTDVGTFWHGTHVAGIVAAPANNIGTVGIAPAATLIGVKVLDNGSGAFSWIIQGIYHAARPIAEGGAGANIINMSLGAGIDGRGAGIAHLLNALSRATSYANHRGATVIAAAGNDGVDIDHTGNLVFVPAQSVGVLSISATGPMGWALGATNVDRPASYTNFGQSAISFAAPGGDYMLPGSQVCSKPRFPLSSGLVVVQYCWVFDMVMAPARGSSDSAYAWAAGTSMASPMVAGVAALIVGKYGPLPPAQVAARLLQSADDLGRPGNDDFYGQGRVNALRAVQ